MVIRMDKTITAVIKLPGKPATIEAIPDSLADLQRLVGRSACAESPDDHPRIGTDAHRRGRRGRALERVEDLLAVASRLDQSARLGDPGLDRGTDREVTNERREEPRSDLPRRMTVGQRRDLHAELKGLIGHETDRGDAGATHTPSLMYP